MTPDPNEMRQKLQAHLDAIAKRRGFTPVKLGQQPPTAASEPLRGPPRSLEPQKAAALPCSTSRAVESLQEPWLEHASHQKATELLAPFRESLGAAYPTLHLLARWSVEHATEQDPAPHLMTTYWSLEEALGLCERTLRRHLVEAGHPWSETVRHLIDLRHNYGQMLDGKDDEGRDRHRVVVTGMVLRFFPRGRQTQRAKVKRWGRRDLVADADEGRTRPTRQRVRSRYQRQKMQMSAYRSVQEQARIANWLFIKLGQTVSERSNNKDCGNLYADIPTNHVLNALQADLRLMLEAAAERGASITRARTRWVNTAAKLLAERHGDHRPLPCHDSEWHITHWDGFTNLWRRILWTAIKTELYAGTSMGWRLTEHMIHLAREGCSLGKTKPAAWAYSQVREELEELYRTFGSGRAGTYLIA